MAWYNKNMHNWNKRGGFTLIELSLSIAFMSVLALAVVLIIANSISAYHRGLILNQVNTTGMALVDEMRATVQNAPVVSLVSMCDVLFENTATNPALDNCKKTDGSRLVLGRHMSEVKIDKNNDKSKRSVPISGAFCTGNYSYIWNTGYFFSENSSVTGDMIKFYYRDENGNNGEWTNKIRLLKVKDQDRAVCAAYSPEDNEINIRNNIYNAITEDPVDLLAENSSLALYDLYAPVPATNAMNNNMYYSISFILGTLQGGADITESGNFCAVPEGDGDNSGVEEFDYCAINKFNFAAEAIGGEK